MAVNTRRVKSVEESIRDTDEPEHRLKKNLSGLDLTVFGVGVIIGTGIFVLVPLTTLAELVNIGTLFAFLLVSIGVLVLRRTRPDLPRAFRVPFVPVLPILSALACLWLMVNLPAETWIRFLVWMALGVVLYAVHGRRRSRMATGVRAPASSRGAR